MPQKRVLCSECARERQLLDASGNKRFVSCNPEAGDPRFCTLVYEFAFVPGGGQAGGGAPPAGGGNPGGGGN